MGHSLPCPTGKRLAQRLAKFEKLVTRADQLVLAAKNELIGARIYRTGMGRELRRLQRLQKRQASA